MRCPKCESHTFDKVGHVKWHATGTETVYYACIRCGHQNRIGEIPRTQDRMSGGYDANGSLPFIREIHRIAGKRSGAWC